MEIYIPISTIVCFCLTFFSLLQLSKEGLNEKAMACSTTETMVGNAQTIAMVLVVMATVVIATRITTV